jgi:hypothetical protein
MLIKEEADIILKLVISLVWISIINLEISRVICLNNRFLNRFIKITEEPKIRCINNNNNNKINNSSSEVSIMRAEDIMAKINLSISRIRDK